jgi:hypothetical protein
MHSVLSVWLRESGVMMASTYRTRRVGAITGLKTVFKRVVLILLFLNSDIM